MNPLVLQDLFFTICDYLKFKQIVTYELISRNHLKMIRQHAWYHYLNIRKNKLLLTLIGRYQLKNLDLSFTDVTDEISEVVKMSYFKSGLYKSDR